MPIEPVWWDSLYAYVKLYIVHLHVLSIENARRVFRIAKHLRSSWENTIAVMDSAAVFLFEFVFGPLREIAEEISDTAGLMAKIMWLVWPFIFQLIYSIEW